MGGKHTRGPLLIRFRPSLCWDEVSRLRTREGNPKPGPAVSVLLRREKDERWRRPKLLEYQRGGAAQKGGSEKLP